jgi:hypothetical protein
VAQSESWSVWSGRGRGRGKGIKEQKEKGGKKPQKTNQFGFHLPLSSPDTPNKNNVYKEKPTSRTTDQNADQKKMKEKHHK